MVDKKALDTLEEDTKKKCQTQQAVNEGDTKRKGVENGDKKAVVALEDEAKEKSQTLQVVNEGDTKKGVLK